MDCLKCLKCRSTNISTILGSRFVCRDCGHTYKISDPEILESILIDDWIDRNKMINSLLNKGNFLEDWEMKFLREIKKYVKLTGKNEKTLNQIKLRVKMLKMLDYLSC